MDRQDRWRFLSPPMLLCTGDFRRSTKCTNRPIIVQCGLIFRGLPTKSELTDYTYININRITPIYTTINSLRPTIQTKGQELVITTGSLFNQELTQRLTESYTRIIIIIKSSTHVNFSGNILKKRNISYLKLKSNICFNIFVPLNSRIYYLKKIE